MGPLILGYLGTLTETVLSGVHKALPAHREFGIQKGKHLPSVSDSLTQLQEDIPVHVIWAFPLLNHVVYKVPGTLYSSQFVSDGYDHRTSFSASPINIIEASDRLPGPGCNGSCPTEDREYGDRVCHSDVQAVSFGTFERRLIAQVEKGSRWYVKQEGTNIEDKVGRHVTGRRST
ncbi:MAG: hypothetical protein Q9170_007365 [Blastenia crenularia]